VYKFILLTYLTAVWLSGSCWSQSTYLSGVCGFDSRTHHLGIKPATPINSAWPSLRGQVQWVPAKAGE